MGAREARRGFLVLFVLSVAALCLTAPAAAEAPPAAAAASARAEARRKLQEELGAITSRGALAGARAGILVESLDSGEVVFARSPDELFNPASNVKLFTSAAALAGLGPEYRFETEFLLAPGSGSAKNLYVRGKGDPTLVTERLWAIAGELAHIGVERVGDLVLDDSWFDEERFGPGYDQERGDRAYLAPAGAISLNFNAVAVSVAPGNAVGAPGRVYLEPASDFLSLENRTVTARTRSLRRVVLSSQPAGARQRVTVEGKLPLGGRRQVFYRRVDDPALYFGHTLRRLLELRGVKVQGRVRRGYVPQGATLAYVSESDALAAVVRQLDKQSNNFMAEQILKALGAELRGPPGTWPKGVAAVEDFLATAGVPRGSYLMRNGSGLNDANRFSARQTVALLKEMWHRFPLMVEFVGALPVAGRDGTIRWRMEGTAAAGHLRAKTGTLEGVTSLSGYVETRDGEHLAFAVLVNDAGRGTARAVDDLGTALASVGPPAPAVAERAPGPAGDAAQRVASYYRIALAHDPRNVPFLRTALRGEQDPAVRMAAGEAVYLSEPDGDGSRRAFLEAFAPDPAALKRLRELAGEGEAPVVRSLAALAAEGVPDALVALAELSSAGMAQELAPTWTEVAATAPGETLELLLSAPEALADAVLASLAAGGKDGGADPALVAAARQAAEGDGASAARARDLCARLEGRLPSAPAAQAPGPASAGTAAPAPPAPPPGG
ncbi:MAG TPA: D-alanyl-D-alanine carboxypeptidase/D-alanyl-D-alanine-endopeptidase [Anaeromyxobacteraceae bacterium]|nr:D-alanyl-D-alanine carboxypeptidase/D-alanyl-D-alanine-endopeptidase [Anaeromyxobacteraceae bacterium]